MTILHLLRRKHYYVARRLEEGHNLYDADYARWLKKKHPEVIYEPTESESIANYFKDVDAAVSKPILETSNSSLDSPSHDDQLQPCMNDDMSTVAASSRNSTLYNFRHNYYPKQVF